MLIDAASCRDFSPAEPFNRPVYMAYRVSDLRKFILLVEKKKS